MSSSFLICPLCSQPGFQTLDSLRYGLISAATRQVVCPVCDDILFGLDKFTIHLFSHSVQHQLESNNTTVPIGISSFRNAAAPLNQQSFLPSLTNGVLVHTKADFNNKVQDIKECPNSNNHTNLSPIISQKTIPLSTGCWSKEVVTEDKLRLENVSDKQGCKIVPDTGEAAKKYEPEKSEINEVWEKQSHSNKKRDCKYAVTSQNSSVAVLDYTQSNSELIEVQTTTKSSQTVSECPQRSQVAKIGKGYFSLESKPSHPPYHYSSGHISETTHQNASVHCLVLSSALSQDNSTQIIPAEKGTNGIIRCDICGFAFEDSSILAIHHQLVHCTESKSAIPKHRIEALDGCKQGPTLGEKQQFPCHLCSKAFKMRGSLMVHLRVAHSSGIVSGKSFIRRVDPDNPSEERKFGCHVCSKSFKKEQHLQQHLKTHEGKQWECDVCSKLFTTKYFLKKHKRLHTGETPYSCDTCSKTFTFQQSYHKHLLYHSDDKPHVCTECDRAFKELSTLHNHQRIHTGEKPFACETCGKCFRQRVSYLVHRRIHTGVMPYRCTACDKSFRYKVSQRTHKCPSQPPGTVIRQSSDLVQKLLQGAQQKVATSNSQVPPAHTVANNDGRGRNGETQQPLSTVRLSDESHSFPFPQQQSQHQQFNDNQFTIIVGSDVQSLFPTGQIFLASGSLCGGPSSSTQVVHSNTTENSKMKQRNDAHKVKEEIGLLGKKKDIQNPPNPAVIGAAMTTPDLKTDKKETKERKHVVQDGNNNVDVDEMKKATGCNPTVSLLNVGCSLEEFCHKSNNNANTTLTTGNKLDQDLAFLQESDFQVSAEDELQVYTCNSTDFYKSSNKRCKSVENLDLVVETTDFFTMIMSPLVKGLHSPSEKLRHLTLSSPVETLLDSEDDGMYQLLTNSADTVVPTSQHKITCSTSTELSKRNNKTAQTEGPGIKPLQTINQESLKQLLYGTPGS